MKLRFCSALSLLSILTLSLQAQKMHPTFRAGVNLANISTKANGRFDEANQITSFQAGFVNDIHLAAMFYLQPGILLTGKGAKFTSGQAGDAAYYKGTTKPFYVELPLTLLVKSPGRTKFFAGAGPYLAIGAFGKNEVTGMVGIVPLHRETNIRFSDDDPSTMSYEEGAGIGIMKRIDYGFNGTAGIETKGIVLAAQFGYGLAKLQSGSNSSEDDYNKHRVISFTIGFKL
jgi:hypothetical protein